MISARVNAPQNRRELDNLVFPVPLSGFKWERGGGHKRWATDLKPGVPVCREYSEKKRWAIPCVDEKKTIDEMLFLAGLDSVPVSEGEHVHVFIPWSGTDPRVAAIESVAKASKHPVVLHREPPHALRPEPHWGGHT